MNIKNFITEPHPELGMIVKATAAISVEVLLTLIFATLLVAALGS